MANMQRQLDSHQSQITTLQSQNLWLTHGRWLDREPIIMASLVAFLTDALKGEDNDTSPKPDNTHPKQVFLRRAFAQRHHPLFYSQGSHLFDLVHLEVLLSGTRHSVRNDSCHLEGNWPMLCSELFGLEYYHYRGGPSNCYTVGLIYLCVILRAYGFLRPFLDFVDSDQHQYPKIPHQQRFRLWQYL